MNKREQWGSRIGFILAASGSAVGLGNIWKYPHMAGENGGAAFTVIYLICILIVGLPIVIAEFVIGRKTQLSPVGAFKVLALKGGKTGTFPDGTDPRGRRSVAFRSQSLSGLMLACRQPWGGACVSGVSPRDSDHNQTPVVTRGDGMVNSPWANRRP